MPGYSKNANFMDENFFRLTMHQDRCEGPGRYTSMQTEVLPIEKNTLHIQCDHQCLMCFIVVNRVVLESRHRSEECVVTVGDTLSDVAIIECEVGGWGRGILICYTPV